MQEQAVELREQKELKIDEQPERKLSPIRKYSGALLDIDGILIDSEELHYKERVMLFGRYGIDFTREMHIAYFIKDDGSGTKGFLEDYNLKGKITLEEARAECDRIFSEELVDKLEPKKGAIESLEYLNGIHVPIAAVTTNYRRSAITSLKEVGIIPGYIEIKKLVAHEDVTNRKPHGEPYLKGAELIKVHIKDCVVVEDSPKGIISANRAGAGLVIACPDEWTYNLDFTGEARPDKFVGFLDEIIKLDLFWERH